MNKRIKRSPYYYGNKSDFEAAIAGMKPIKGVQGINEINIRWFVHPETCKIVRLLKLEQNPISDDQYTWTETAYDPSSDMGFSKSGYKQVKVAGKTLALHRLIAYTFLPNEDANKKYVLHRNGNRRDNRASNLMLCTKKELLEHKRQPGAIRLNLKSRRLLNNQTEGS